MNRNSFIGLLLNARLQSEAAVNNHQCFDAYYALYATGIIKVIIVLKI